MGLFDPVYQPGYEIPYSREEPKPTLQKRFPLVTGGSVPEGAAPQGESSPVAAPKPTQEAHQTASDVDEEIKNLEAEQREDDQELAERHQQEIDETKADHAHELEGVSEPDEVARIKDEHADEDADLGNQHNQELRDQQEEHDHDMQSAKEDSAENSNDGGHDGEKDDQG